MTHFSIDGFDALMNDKEIKMINNSFIVSASKKNKKAGPMQNPAFLLFESSLLIRIL